MKSLIKTLLFIFPLYAQYPADSLYNDSENGVLQKIFLYPITQWQRISYNNSNIECQFYPNCSLYAAQSIHEHGSLSGLFITSDRIIRCSPFAQSAHQKINGEYNIDGRLVDPVNISANSYNKKSPILAAGLSMLIPGLGRVYSGRIGDGLIGFTFASLALNKAIKSHKNNSLFAPLYIGIAIPIYGGEIYGAYRSAKYY